MEGHQRGGLGRQNGSQRFSLTAHEIAGEEDRGHGGRTWWGRGGLSGLVLSRSGGGSGRGALARSQERHGDARAPERAQPGVVQEGAGGGGGGAGSRGRSLRQGPRVRRGAAEPAPLGLRGGSLGDEGRDGQAAQRPLAGGPEKAHLLRLRPPAAGSTYREDASPAAGGRRPASGPFLHRPRPPEALPANARSRG